MSDTTEEVHPFVLPKTGIPLSEWMEQYGRKLTLEDLQRLIHGKDATIPTGCFVIWSHQALMGSYSGWVLSNVHAIRVLWHSTTKGNVTERSKPEGDWYFVERPMALPYTNAPVF